MVFQHVKRPEWGRGVVVHDLADRSKYAFEHGGERTFLHGDAQVVAISLAAEEREALSRAFEAL